MMAVWTTAYINDLPDSHFLYVEPGGSKDDQGKTVPRSLRHFPYKDASGKVDLPHLRNALSRIPQSKLPSEVKSRLTTKAQRLLENATGRASVKPFEGVLARLGSYEFEIRSQGDEGGPILAGTLVKFNEWNEIRSAREGHFMETVEPTAFDKTISERGDRLQVLFDHGDDPSIGRKPLGRVRSLTPQDGGLSYEVELLDADYVRGLLPGLEAGLYGMSFNFRAVRTKETNWPKRSAHNPAGLPEKVLQEVEMREFGPTPFPVYKGTSAALRSLTDELKQPSISLDELRSLIDPEARADALTADEEEGDQVAAPVEEPSARRGSSTGLYGMDRKEDPSWRLP
jgi:HK97 family phage prohead protease